MTICMFVTVTGMFLVGELIDVQDDVYTVDTPMMVGYARQEPNSVVLVPYPPYAESKQIIKMYRHGLLCEPYTVSDELKQMYLRRAQKQERTAH